MDRLSLRAWLAILLAGSALLFLVGIYLERGVASPEAPVAGAPTSQPEASHAEGEGSEAGETSEEEAAELRPLGIDLESPLFVGGAVLVPLLLALAAIRTTNPFVPLAILGFASLFAVFDVLEVSYQLGASRIGLAMIAAVLAVLHVAAGLLAVGLIRGRRLATT